MNNVWIGYDPRVPLQYNVLAHSIVTTAQTPVSVSPIIIEQVDNEVKKRGGKGFYRAGLTQFTWSRFMVPYLCNYEGWSLFMDSDMVVQDDINKLFDMADDKYAVMVVKNPLRFEWASLMLFNNAKCKALTPEYIMQATGLHKINWCDESEIGELPAEWNHLENVDPPKEKYSCIHYTQGVPYWDKTKDTPNAASWYYEARFMNMMPEWEDLMGNSVHHKGGEIKKGTEAYG